MNWCRRIGGYNFTKLSLEPFQLQPKVTVRVHHGRLDRAPVVVLQFGWSPSETGRPTSTLPASVRPVQPHPPALPVNLDHKGSQLSHLCPLPLGRTPPPPKVILRSGFPTPTSESALPCQIYPEPVHCRPLYTYRAQTRGLRSAWGKRRGLYSWTPNQISGASMTRLTRDFPVAGGGVHSILICLCHCLGGDWAD